MALSAAAQEANREQEPQKIADYSVYPQEIDTKISLTDTPVKQSIDSKDIENGETQFYIWYKIF